MEFHKILQSIIEEKNMSIPEIAKATGISDSTLRSIISRKSKNISLEVAFKISKGIGVSLERLNGDISSSIEKTIIEKTENKLSEKEDSLLKNFNELNDSGKNKVINYTKDLKEVPKYQKESNIDETPTKIKHIWEEPGKEHLMPIAAHDDNLTDDEKEQMNAIINETLKNLK